MASPEPIIFVGFRRESLLRPTWKTLTARSAGPDGLDIMTVLELRNMLKERGLDDRGKKGDLVLRLRSSGLEVEHSSRNDLDTFEVSKDFGPAGHDYSRVVDDNSILPLDQESVDSMLARRLKAKLAQDFAEADRVTKELGGHGITIHDRYKIWRCDGQPFEAPWHEFSGSGDHGLDESTVRQVESLIARRIRAKKASRFAQADDLREQLRYLGVDVDDRARSWYVLGAGGHGYERIGPYIDLDVERVDTLLLRRVQAKRSRDFTTADRLQDELRSMGVEVNDARREWLAMVS